MLLASSHASLHLSFVASPYFVIISKLYFSQISSASAILRSKQQAAIPLNLSQSEEEDDEEMETEEQQPKTAENQVAQN